MGNFLKCNQKSHIMTSCPFLSYFTFVYLPFSVVYSRDWDCKCICEREAMEKNNAL